METDDLNKEAELLAQKEAWVQQIADIVVENIGVNLKTALAGAHWASLWMDDLKVLMAQRVYGTKEELKELINQAWSSSLARAETISRYPGLSVNDRCPSLVSIRAANEAFCLAFGEEADFARELISGK